MRSTQKVPWILVGGGLANCILALRLQAQEVDFLLIEAGHEVAGDHTWSCHETDLSPENWNWLKTFARSSWISHTVIFPEFKRTFGTGYATVRSADLRNKMREIVPAEKILLNTSVKLLDEREVECKSESSEFRLESQNLVVSTGFSPVAQFCGFQKFVGWDVEFAQPHGVKEPILMDATVEQKDGYRFIYLLPLTEKVLLVEDTRYSNTSDIDVSEFAESIHKYLASKFGSAGFDLSKIKILREEVAALPIPIKDTAKAGCFGVAGGFLNPTTGYSMPYAFRSSEALIKRVNAGESAQQALRQMQKEMSLTQNYYFLLNRMMFLAARPEERRKIFSRFYGLSEDLIARFYSGQLNAWDRLRLLVGRPPVKISSAIKVLSKNSTEAVWI